jgi:hypothetical protein
MVYSQPRLSRTLEMSDHGHDHGHGGAAVAEAPGHGPAAAPDLRFEKQELHEFEAADRGAGRNIGVMLALIFCVLFVLMSSVTFWTSIYHADGDDPYATTGPKADAEHH